MRFITVKKSFPLIDADFQKTKARSSIEERVIFELQGDKPIISLRTAVHGERL